MEGRIFLRGIDSTGMDRDRPEFFGYPLLTQERVKLYGLQILYAYITGSIEKKSMKNFEKKP